MKSTADVKRKAGELKAPFVEFMRRELGDFGDEVDQLRVLGYLSEAMMKLAETELTALKLLRENGESRIVHASDYGWHDLDPEDQ